MAYDSDIAKLRVKNGLCRHCSAKPSPGVSYCNRCLTVKKRSRHKLKFQVMTHYGGRCNCCGESRLEFLQIDHIDGNGNKHRREVTKGAGDATYRWLKRNNYPVGYRVLCASCNIAFGLFGYCPHHATKIDFDYESAMK